MFSIEKSNATVCFEYNGKSFCLTEEEIEAAYRRQHHKYRMIDAERALAGFIFKYMDADLDNPYEEDAEAAEEFENEYKISIATARSREKLEEYVKMFERSYSIEEDTEYHQWMNVIRSVLLVDRLRLNLLTGRDILLKNATVKEISREIAALEGWTIDSAEATVTDFVKEMYMHNFKGSMICVAGTDRTYMIEMYDYRDIHQIS